MQAADIRTAGRVWREARLPVAADHGRYFETTVPKARQPQAVPADPTSESGHAPSVFAPSRKQPHALRNVVSAAVPANHVGVLQLELRGDVHVAVQHASKAGGPRVKVVPPKLAQTTTHERVPVLHYFCHPADGQGRGLGSPVGLREHFPIGRRAECGKTHSHETGVQ